MRIKKLAAALVLGLGFTLAIAWLLDGGRLPVARAASLTVTQKGDSNDGVCDTDCSLREAIIEANGNGEADTITLGLGRFDLSIVGTGENSAATGDLDITDDLTIEGLGPDQTFIDAGSLVSDRVLDIRSGASTVVISGVTIMNGHITGQGGGIYNSSADLTLINVKVTNNVVTGTGTTGRGGGVYVSQGSLTLDGVEIVSNTANTDGGGVYVDQGSVWLDGAQVISNTANLHGGGVYLRYGSGTLSSGGILSNTAGGSGGGVASYYAGAAFTQTGDSMVAYNSAAFNGGGVYAYQGSVTLMGGQVFSNSAGLYGGGVVAYQTGARFAMSGGYVISNTAEERGGGIYVYYDSGATMSGGEVAHNTADNGGGVYVSSGVFTQTGGLLAHNTAEYGGGVYVGSGTAMLNGGQVIANTADLGGGGLYNNSGTLILVNTTVSGNRATSSNGGGLYNSSGMSVLTYTTVVSNVGNGPGGGIHGWSGGNLTLQNTILAYNAPANCGGTLASTGHNLDSGTSCGFSATGDITATDPLLGPLVEENGAWVHPLPEDSPAVDEGLCLPDVTMVDQRGTARPQGIACDIGAYEYGLDKVFLPLVLNNY